MGTVCPQFLAFHALMWLVYPLAVPSYPFALHIQSVRMGSWQKEERKADDQKDYFCKLGRWDLLGSREALNDAQMAGLEV